MRGGGTYGQIVVEMLKYVEFDYQDLNVVIGPATSSTYEINDDIKKKFETLPINSDKYIETRDTDRHGIDLKLANALLLINSGVPAENINITKYTTSEDLSLFSYRVEKGKTGRMLAFIGQKEKCSVMQLYHYNPLCHYKVKRLIYNESDRKFRKIQTEINHHLEKV